MERKPFEGVINIIRFNRHFYITFLAVNAVVLLAGYLLPAFRLYSWIFILLSLFPVYTSLLVSYFVYDRSPLYKLNWLDPGLTANSIVNIHAGYDETSAILQGHFPNATLSVFDFYNPRKHTEISIRRARKRYLPYPGTQQISTVSLPLPKESIDIAFTILAAHEIRDEEERIVFFQELRRVTKDSGKIIVTEHLRDSVNFLAYTLGVFHFHGKATWLKTFDASGLKVSKEIKITPFITTFILHKNGTAS